MSVAAGEATGRRVAIGISGSAGTGKSTLARCLAEALQVPYIDEGIRARFDAGLDLHTLTREQHAALIDELLDELLEAASGALTRHGGFVSDRCPVDYLAFWLYYGMGFMADERSATLVRRVQAGLALFDLVVVLPWGSIELRDDGVRSPFRWVQLHYQALLEGLLQGHQRPRHLVAVPATVRDLEARVAMILEQRP